MVTETHAVAVLLPVPVDRAYTYLADRPLVPGTIVGVPLGPREVLGVVWPVEAEAVDPRKLKAISRIFPVPPLSAAMLDFVGWIAEYTLSPPGMVLKMVLRSPGALEQEKPIAGVRLSGPPPERMTSARARVLAVVADGLAWTKSGLAAAAGVSPGVVGGLVDQGTLEIVSLPVKPAALPPKPDFAVPELTASQDEAAAALKELIGDGYKAALLDGVTGSGKTEVYFEAVADVIRQGRQVLILLPEIALTASFLERFASRFGAPPASWHSEVGTKGRERVWRGVGNGDVQVVVGARSALFLPFADLGLIIVDEEHDPAFKQEEGVIYHARDMAVTRAFRGGFPVILASATPSVESRVNADRGRYTYVRLPGRYGEAGTPDIVAIDLRQHQPERQRWLSPPLVAAVEETLAADEQSLLFLNRRGYAPLTLCRTCGYRLSCPHCSAWLVEHRFRGILACHHCGHEVSRPEACPDCENTDSLAACGPGVERLQDEVLERWPDARTLVLSSDLGGGIQRLRLELQAIKDGKVDIVIGTQLVAKGHNFPELTLVGVVDADLGLAQDDPRAGERVFQLLTQVTGRAGRAGQASRALIQTYAPDHPVLQALISGDREGFYASECENRRRGGLPPFGRLAGIVVSARDRAPAMDHARAMALAASSGAGPGSNGLAGGDVRLLGPAEAPLALIRGRYRFRLLVHGPDVRRLHDWLRGWLAACPRPRGSVRVSVDIDPQSFV